MRVNRTFSFSQETLDALDFLSALTGRTKTSILEEAINLYIEQNGLKEKVEEFLEMKKQNQGG